MKLILLFTFLAINSNVFSQNNAAIIRAYAYERMVSGGAQHVDETGKTDSRPDPEYYIYLEIKKGYTPKINSLFIEGAGFKGNFIRASSPVQILEPDSSGKNIVRLIKASGSNVLWFLNVDGRSGIRISSKYKKDVSNNNVVIKGTLNNIQFSYNIKKMIKLSPVFTE